MGLLSPKFVQLSSVLTRPNDTTAYSIGDLVANNTSAGSVVVPSFSLVSPQDAVAEMIEIDHSTLYSNLTTGAAAAQFHIDLWSVAPTFTNGDNGAYAPATGAASWVGHLTTTVDAGGQMGDGFALVGTPGQASTDNYTTNPILWARKPGDQLFWSLKLLTTLTPIANETFTLVLKGRVQ